MDFAFIPEPEMIRKAMEDITAAEILLRVRKNNCNPVLYHIFLPKMAEAGFLGISVP